MARLALSLLGPPRLERDGQPLELQYRKNVALMAYLAVTGQAHTREALVTLLWPELEPGRARANLRRNLSLLRSALGEAWLDADRERVGLNPDGDLWLDVRAFRALLAGWRKHGHGPDEVCAQCLEELGEAAELYRGDFLAGFSLRDSVAYDDWQFFQSEGLRQEMASALERLVRGHSERGAYAEAVPYARRWVALDPLHEPAHYDLMRAYARSGQRAAALRQYEECARVLREELDVEPGEETTQLYERIRTGEDVTGFPKPVTSVKRHNLPVQVTSFIGRELVLAQIGERLRDPGCRLLTLVGPGGIGKTRLALEAARREVGRYEDGVYWAALAPLRSADTMVSAVAQAVGFSLVGGGDPWQRLLDYLSPRQMLLVLDNLEHLLEIAHPAGRGAVDLVNDILRAAPGVKVVVTSRATLNVQSEHLLPISGMACPAPPARPSPQAASLLRSEDALRYSAVQLFLATAQRVRPGFEPTAGELADVAQTCRLVGGMPLAMLLAAAWMEMLSPAEIVAELEQGYGLLEGELRDLPERQRSVEAVFDASWQMLDDAERETFARLSVFRGGFEREAAQEIAGASLRTLRSLVHKSFLQRDAAGRYGVHELLRQYAEHKLAEDAAMRERTANRHCHYYLTMQSRATADVGSDPEKGLWEYLPEIDNVRAGWYWAVNQARYAEIVANIGLGLFWGMGTLAEVVTFLEWAAGVLRARCADGVEGEKGVALGLALIFQGRAYQEMGSGGQREDLVGEGVSILRRLGARRELADIALPAAWAMAPICAAEARAILEESIAYYREQGDLKGVSNLLGALGELAVRRGAYDEAEGYCREAIRIGEQIGNTFAVGYAFVDLAKVAYYRGEYESARQHYEGFVATVGKSGWKGWLGWQSSYLGDAALAMGDYEGARASYQRARAMFEETVTYWMEAASGEHYGVAYSLDRLGETALAEGDVGQARELYKQALAIAWEHPQVTLHLDVVVSHAALLAHEGRRERAVELAALALHHPRSRFEVIKRAQKLLEELEAALPPDVYTTAQERGRARELEATVEELLAGWA